ncbi:DUF6089 family protein [Gelidibacter japonicus]|jgi:hypothetical protein|uniref:type IX secretion system protein PorG n=1 Tax=Gelidibacter japonicus TaxID=1962232 RepID=UPI0013D16718|nr:DUF6089 family protein [Gelidibacter japonicus]MCL8007973.1 DUF6089 family protein [Gelidibacter japonicus]
MRYIILIIFSVCFISNIQAQIYEGGLFLGGSNFIGDVGSTTYIAPNKPAMGLLIKWNRSPRHSFRASLMFTELEGIDGRSNDPRRIARNYNFKNSILEFSAGMEFTFLDFDLHSTDPQMTPYLYTGISTARHNNYFFQGGVQTSENSQSWAYGIPMILGFKTTTMLDGVILGAEIGIRYTFSDEIDGSVPDAPSRAPFSFGNLNSNDWYVFSGITLTYTFGQKPCYCNF